MTTALPAHCPAPVATLPPRGSARTLTLSVPKTVTFSMPIDNREKQQTANGPQAATGKPGGCTQPTISDPQRGQLATPLDGPQSCLQAPEIESGPIFCGGNA